MSDGDYMRMLEDQKIIEALKAENEALKVTVDDLRGAYYRASTNLSEVGLAFVDAMWDAANPPAQKEQP